MIALLDWLRSPSDVAERVSPAEYARLLGYPAGQALDGAVLKLAESTRDWYRNHGRAWAFGREVEIDEIDGDEIALNDEVRLESSVLARRLRGTAATAVTVAAVSAGPEVDERSASLWSQDRPDEAFFLDRFAAAVAEHLARASGEALRADDTTRVALPGYSPGYDGWDLTQQRLVHSLLVGDPRGELPGPLGLMESGMLTPKNSLLAVFGMTGDRALAARAWARNRCSWCSLAECDFRTVPR